MLQVTSATAFLLKPGYENSTTPAVTSVKDVGMNIVVLSTTWNEVTMPDSFWMVNVPGVPDGPEEVRAERFAALARREGFDVLDEQQCGAAAGGVLEQ